MTQPENGAILFPSGIQTKTEEEMEDMRIAVITGASSGMGREFVFALDRREKFDEIWVIARREHRLEELRGKCRAKIRPLPMDLQKRESYAAYKELLEKEKPEIAVLVNAAGFGLFGTFNEMDMITQLDSVNLNTEALTAMCHISIPYMSRGSRIYNMGSRSSWNPVPYVNVYAATKAYVLSFSRSLNAELEKMGIKVIAVCPNWVKTEFFDHAVHDDTIKFYNHYFTAKQVVKKAVRDMEKGRDVSIVGFSDRVQVALIKHLPTKMVLDIWTRQQGMKPWKNGLMDKFFEFERKLSKDPTK